MSEDAALAAARQRIADYRQRIDSLDQDARDLLFSEARNHNWWQDRKVSDDQLREIYDLFKFAPTSQNTQTARIVFVRSPEAKARLVPTLNEPNREKTDLAPATAIIAHDPKFYEDFAKVYPIRPEAGQRFVDNPDMADDFAFHMASMQGAYFILAVRAVGLDAGAMLGFDKAKVNDEFFSDSGLKVNFLCNIGYGDLEGIKGPRLYRYDFDEVCEII
ncbi:MAG: malonic semialdehyde reductase [Alphaproteobacteria bacterium]|nr:malonic semialdehyde reductase [Alphaproteobacteria bacterium]